MQGQRQLLSFKFFWSNNKKATTAHKLLSSEDERLQYDIRNREYFSIVYFWCAITQQMHCKRNAQRTTFQINSILMVVLLLLTTQINLQ